jgi:hypothetical protein
MRNVNCTTCFHRDRDTIDQQMIAGTPYRRISQQFGLSLGSISRHREHIREIIKHAEESASAEHGSRLAQRVERLLDEAQALLERAKSKENITRAQLAQSTPLRAL